MRAYFSSPDSIGKWCYEDFLRWAKPAWPVYFLVTFAQIADKWTGWGKHKWVIKDYRFRMKNALTKNGKPPEETGGLFFLDSGAHSLYEREVHGKLGKSHSAGYSYYDGEEFWAYVDEYAAFVKKWRKYIDYYANVDVIFHPEKSWEVLKYLEDEYDLSPVPVIHYGTPLKWIHKHLDAGYEYLGIGGLGQEVTAASYHRWADQVFDIICPPPARLPIVRTHGFAMTAYNLMLRYPWWSVDSATWTKVGAFGSILVPHKRGGKFTFEVAPYQMSVSVDSGDLSANGKHYQSASQAEQSIVREWLAEINVPLGKNHPTKKDEDGKPLVIEYGVINRHSERKIANLLFFERLRKWLPQYPWAFKPRSSEGRGLF